MDPYLPLDYQIAALRSEYRNTTALQIELQTRLILDADRFSRFPRLHYYPVSYPYIYPSLYSSIYPSEYCNCHHRRECHHRRDSHHWH